MRLRANHREAVAVRFSDSPWVASPEPGVARKLLQREGEEIARATSIVRYAPGSSFSQHVHERGEEFFVLDGVFSDEHGDYARGTYVRNPPGSMHRPFSHGGCTIFVKLRQHAPDDLARKVVGMGDGWIADRKLLHVHGHERVELLRLDAPTTIAREDRGIEILVVDGRVSLGGADAPRWTWSRTPAHSVAVTPLGPALLWIKSGHLDIR